MFFWQNIIFFSDKNQWSFIHSLANGGRKHSGGLRMPVPFLYNRIPDLHYKLGQKIPHPRNNHRASTLENSLGGVCLTSKGWGHEGKVLRNVQKLYWDCLLQLLGTEILSPTVKSRGHSTHLRSYGAATGPLTIYDLGTSKICLEFENSMTYLMQGLLI